MHAPSTAVAVAAAAGQSAIGMPGEFESARAMRGRVQAFCL
eukprot:CAMPEP_0168457346 /NCGR_PEP_ID=MMETSP0228-20121227/51785_1 /TAXON_ID=133427 /ORGANISM="Protoceratium reticulatum, Strain CCCM 535 (=CCMP 1889)" /LENGTH=40 /DNA_ID= /DNA_START= /DNA_END= /DNA_ORIENTATION=